MIRIRGIAVGISGMLDLCRAVSLTGRRVHAHLEGESMLLLLLRGEGDWGNQT